MSVEQHARLAATCADCGSPLTALCGRIDSPSRTCGLAKLTYSVHVTPPRRLICRAGERIDGFIIVSEGWAASSLSLPDGRRQILSFLLPGDIISAAQLFDVVAPSTVEAVTPVRYVKFDRLEMRRQLMEIEEDGVIRLSRLWASERSRHDQLVVDLGRRSAGERIARLIVDLAYRALRQRPQQGDAFEFPLRLHHIADATGLTGVHVGNILTQFRRDGLIDIAARSMTILDFKGLERLVLK